MKIKLFQILYLISILSSIFFLFNTPYYIPGGASHFTDWANIIAKGGFAYPQMAQRDIGYPFFLYLTAFPYLNSFVITSFALGVLSSLAPICIYYSFDRNYVILGFFVSLFSMGLLWPYFFIKTIHHDGLFLCLSVLCFYFSVRFYIKQDISNALLLIFSVTFLSFTKPAGNFIGIIFVLSFFITDFLNNQFKYSKFFKYLLILFFIFSSAFLYKVYRENFFDKDLNGKYPSYVGQQLFYNLYVHSKNNGLKINEIGGNQTNNLFLLVQHEIENATNSKLIQWSSLNVNNQLFIDSTYDKNLPLGLKIYKSIIDCPNLENYYLLINHIMGDVDSPFLAASKEIIIKNPLFVLNYSLQNLKRTFFGPPSSFQHYSVLCGGEVDEPWQFFPAYGGVFDIPLRAFDDISPSLSNSLKYLEAIWIGLIPYVFPAVSFLMLLGIVLIRQISPALRYLYISSLLLAVYMALTTSMFAEPLTRYIIFQLPFETIASSIVLFTLTINLFNFLHRLNLINGNFSETINLTFEKIIFCFPNIKSSHYYFLVFFIWLIALLKLVL